MISPISRVSGYDVQAIYGNPASMKRVTSVSDNTVANKAMMTVSKKEDVSLSENTQKSEEIQATEEKYAKPTALATGGIADIVKQISQMNNSEDEKSQESKEAVSTNLFANEFLKMGYQQNIRDKVQAPTPQSELADVTQKAMQMQNSTPQEINTPDVLAQKTEQVVNQAVGVAS